MKKALVLLLMVSGLLAACSQNIEKEIVGTWENINDKGDCDTNMKNQITFTEDNKINGIEGYEKYEIKKSDDNEYDYAILSGSYEDSTNYRIKIDEDDLFHIVYEEDDVYDFESAIACTMKKISD